MDLLVFMIKKLLLQLVALSAFLLSALSAAAADVQISQLTDTPDPATRGGDITYAISLLNANNDTANDVTLDIPLAADTVFVSVDDVNCTHDGGIPGIVNCNFGNITGDGLGAPVTNVNLVIKTTAATGNTTAITATVATTSPDSNLGNDSSTQNTTVDDGADLNVVQTDSADPVIAGGEYSYTINVNNIGPNNSNTITVTDTLPTNVSYVSASGTGWSCGNAGQTVTCTRASIANGANAPAITLNAKVTGAVTGTITNTVNVSASTKDPVSSNNTSTENTLINEGTDLTLTKSVNAPVVGGATTTFTLSPRNLGPYSADDVSISDTLPAGFTFISAVGAGWTCGEAGGTVTCTRLSYNIGATDNIVITTNVPATGNNITNSATLSSTTPDQNLANNTGFVTFSVVPDGANLSIIKTKTPNPVAQGADMTSSIRVHNSGPNATSGTVTVIDTLSANETYSSFSGSDWTCISAGNQVTCEYGLSIANGANSSYLNIVTVATNSGTLSNTACVSDTAGEIDGVAGNDCASATAISTNAIADLAITKTVSTVGGVNDVLEVNEDTITYVLTVTNTGADIVDVNNGSVDNGVVVNDTVPGFVSGDTVVTAVITGGTEQNFTCSITNASVQCILNDGEIFEGSSDGGVDDTVEITITTQRGLFDGNFTNTATVSSAILGENTLANNSADVAIAVDPIADVQMQSLVISPANAKAGTEVTYVLTFINNGPSTAQDVEVTHLFIPPATRTYELLSTSPSQGSCAALAGHTLTCDIGTLSRNQTETITLTVRPGWDGANNAWTLDNTSSITTTTTESDGTNNSKSTDLNVAQAELDLLINNTDVSDPVGWIPAPGAFDNTIIYKIDMTNRGPSLATGVTLTDVMSPKTAKQITFLCDDAGSAGCTVGTSLCNNLAASATGNATITTTCSLPDIAANTTMTRYLYFKADTAPDSTGDTHVNEATIDSNESDIIPSNDSEAETTSVRAMVDLEVSKDPSKASVSINEPFNWDIVVSNNGPGDSINSALSDNLPAGMTLTATPVPSQGSCTGVVGDSSFTCDFGSINNGGNVTLTVPVKVTVMPGGGSTSNTATVTTFGVDSDNTNNTDTGTVTITKSSIAGIVYNDQNDNGVINASEHGIAGVTITLTGTDNWGNVINKVVVTDVDGAYLVDDLPAGANYTITETHPANFSDGLESKDGNIINNSRITDVITTIVLPTNTAITNYNFAELALASLQGGVWHDLNNDGHRDAGETIGIANATITLTGTETISSKVVNFSAITDANGDYQFSHLTAGNYNITETQPITWGDGDEQLGSAGGTKNNDDFSNIGLGVNQSGVNYNFGELGATLSGYVYRDVNNNAILDGGENRINNVKITLTGIDNNGFNINRNTTTDGNGFYQFIGLPASNGAGYTIKETQPNLIFDGKDSVGTLGGALGNDILSAIVVPVNASGINYNFGEGGDITSSISGIVFIDVNDDGTKDINEVGIENVSVTLTGKNELGVVINETRLTNANGQYSFINIVASDANGYTITQIQPPLYNDGLESKEGVLINGSRITDEINVVLANDENIKNNNFAEIYKGRLSGTVYVDENNNGLFTSAEFGIANVVLTLTGTDINNNPISRSVTTNELGQYVFEQLPPSDVNGYTVTEEHPSLYIDGMESIGNMVITNSNQSDTFTGIEILLTSELTDYNFAELYKTSISGYVYQDKNNNGLKEDELGVQNVTVTLSGVDNKGEPVNTTLVTDDNGYYIFTNLLPSDENGYQINEIQPIEYIDGLESVNNIVIKDSSTSDSIKTIVLTAGQELENYNFGEIDIASLSGTVWIDENDNGVIDDSESLRIANVTITLTGIESSEGETPTEITRTVVTDENGDYTFSMLRPGQYNIAQQQPGAWMDGKDHVGTLLGNLNNDFIDVIQLEVGQHGIAYNFGERGSNLQGVVFNDLNDNAAKEINEAGIPEVKILLTGTDSDGQPVSREEYTVVDGQYVFQNLPLPNDAGYQINEIQPENVDDGKDSIGSHGGQLNNDQINEIVFGNHLTHATDYNFGELLQNPARISGMVWLDSNHNRLEDDGTALSGWTVRLIDSRTDSKDHINITPIATVITDSNGYYLFDGLSPGEYEVIFVHPQGGVVYGYPVSDEPGVDLSAGTIRKITLEVGEHIEYQNLPIDPSGVVYDSQTREAVAGATVTIIGPSGFDANRDLVGGQENITQITGDDGMYQFLLFTSAPSGIYTLAVTEPLGYLPGVSSLIPACNNTPDVVSSPNPALVQANDTPPQLNASIHDANSCGINSNNFSQGENSTQYYLSFNINPQLPSANVVNNHIPVDPMNNGILGVVKTTPTKNVSRGSLVPYIITVTNNLNISLNNMNVIDQLPPGFKYIQGSAKVDGTHVEPVVNGRQLTWENIGFSAAQQRSITLMTVVGAGVGEGEYVNQAWVQTENAEHIVANVADATVRIVPDPLFDCSDIVGKVFNDENTNGYQDEGEVGLPAVRIATAQGLLITTDKDGRYHISCAEVPNELRGSNFILKVDERTLPSGFRISSENPRVVRLTRGKLVKANFGATIHRVVRIQLNAMAFEGSSLLEKYQKSLSEAVSALKLKPSILRLAYQQTSETEDDIYERLELLTEKIEQQWQLCDCQFELIIEQEVTLKGDDLELLGQARRTGHE